MLSNLSKPFRIQKLSFLQLILILILVVVFIEGIGHFYEAHKRQKKEEHRFEDVRGESSRGQVVIYKDREYLIPKPKNVIRILVLGGSAAEGFGHNYNKSWWALLQEELNTHFSGAEKKVEVVNLAKGAQTSIDDLVRFTREGVFLEPDAVILYSGWNDITAFSGNPGWTVRHIAKELSNLSVNVKSYDMEMRLKQRFFIVRKLFQLKNNFEREVSHFYAWLTSLRGELYSALRNSHLWPVEEVEKVSGLNRSQQGPEIASISFQQIMEETNIQGSYLDSVLTYLEPMLKIFREYYRANLVSLANEIAEKKIPALFVYQPDLLYETTHRNLSPEEQLISRRIMGSKSDVWTEIILAYYPEGRKIMDEVARNSEFQFLDMRSITSQHSGEIIFMDNVHYSEEGNRVIAEALKSHVLKLLTPKAGPDVV